MLALHNVDKHYQNGRSSVQALKNIQLTIETGEMVGFLGRTNSGKSTLARCMGFLERPSQGNVIFENRTLNLLCEPERRALRRQIGIITKDPALLLSRSVLENITLGFEMHSNAAGPERRNLARPLLEWLELLEYSDAAVENLSAFIKQKVALARALSMQPQMLLCDDFTANLDSRSSYRLVQYLLEAKQKFPITVAVLSSDVEIIKQLAKRMLVLHQGEIVEQGLVADLLANPQAEATCDLIRSSTRTELPHSLRRRLQLQPLENSHPIWRITFKDPGEQESVLAYAVQRFQLQLSIVQAHLENLLDGKLGVMIAEIQGNEEQLSKASHYLSEQGLYNEVLAYVQ